ncbi:MAG: phosphatidate cytidylyltransferase [Ruminococcaceae bacterium]|nr:phosphatidate cytidylyltransferase [Oscillospiraceae bacterium]
MPKSTMTRVISALIGLVVFFVIALSDALVFEIALGVVILFMLFEFLSAFKFSKTLIVTALIGSLPIIYTTLISDYALLSFSIIAYIGVLAIESVLCYKKVSFEDISKVLFATLYISMFSSFIGLMRSTFDFGIYYLCLIFTCAWMSDTGAYFIGCLFGHKKLAPEISPKKTVAGSIGGVIFSSVGCIILGIVSVLVSKTNANYIALAIIGIIGSVLSQLGDLTASLIKRNCGVKDFGNIMPGHGGMLDRFDSVIMIAPFVFCVCALLRFAGISVF